MMLSVTYPQNTLKTLMLMMGAQPCADRSASAHILASEYKSTLETWNMFQELPVAAAPTTRLLQLKRLGLAATSTWAQ